MYPIPASLGIEEWKTYQSYGDGGYKKFVYLCRNGTDWYDGSILKADGLTIDRFCTASTFLEMGNVNAAACSFVLTAPPLDITSWNIGDEIEVQIDPTDRTTISTPSADVVKMGIFVIDSITERLGVYTIDCLDRMVYLDVEMDWTGFYTNYPITTVLSNIASQCGITLANSISGFPNAAMGWYTNPTMTCRQVVSAIAEVIGANAYMDWDGELRFGWYEPAIDSLGLGVVIDESIAISRYISPQHYDLDDYKIGNPEDSQTEIYNRNEVVYRLVANPLVEGARDYMNVDTIAAAIKAARYDPQRPGGYQFNGGEFTTLPFPYIWPMDILATSVASIPITHVTYKLNGNMLLSSSVEPRVSQANTFTSPQQTIINNMQEATEEINRHFFYANATGAHITTTENDPDTGNNVLIDSSGLYIREDTDVLAEFTATGAVFNENSDNRLRIVNSDTDGTTIISEGHGAYDPILYIAADDKTITSNVESGIIIEMQKGHFSVNELVRRSDLGPGRYAIGDEVFTCYKNNGSWTFRYAGNTDISDVAGIYLPGETVTISDNVPGYGYVPGSPNGRAYLYLDTFHKFPQDKAITINSLTLTVRGPGGLILNAADATAYSPTASVMGNGQIRFFLTGLPTTNMSLNTPLVCFGTFSVDIAQ